MQIKSAKLFLATLAVITVVSQNASAEWMIRARYSDAEYNKDNSSSPSNLRFQNTSAPEVAVNYYPSKDLSFELGLSASRSNTDIGRVWVIPANFTALYHFFSDQPLQVYAGGGVNYTFFSTPSGRDVDYKKDLSPVLQAGSDLQLTKNLLINIDVKKIFLRPKVSYNNAPYETNTMDPWVFGAGLGFKL